MASVGSTSNAGPATSLQCNDMSISILINEKPVEMYKIEQNGNKASCYIEAIEGKEFKTHSSVLRRFDPYKVAFFTVVDGTTMGGVLVSQPGVSAIFDGPNTSETTKQALVFSKINLTDDSDLASNDEQFVKNLGAIQIKAYRGRDTGQRVPPDTSKYGFSADRAVDERSKKASTSHQVGLGKVQAVQKQSSVHVEYLDSTDHPFALFEIKYRSRALLELDDIVKPLVPIETRASSSSPAKPNINQPKKRKAPVELTIDEDGAIVLSDSDEDTSVKSKKEGKKTKESKPKVKEEKGKVWLEID